MTIKTFNMTKKDFALYLLDCIGQLDFTVRTLPHSPTTDDVIETVKEVTGKDIFGKEGTPARDHSENLIDDFIQECEDLEAPVRAFFVADTFRGLVCIKNNF